MVSLGKQTVEITLDTEILEMITDGFVALFERVELLESYDRTQLDNGDAKNLFHRAYDPEMWLSADGKFGDTLTVTYPDGTFRVFKHRDGRSTSISTAPLPTTLEVAQDFEYAQRMQATVVSLVRAVLDEGSHPYFHRQVVNNGRSHFPILWKQIDALVADYKKQQQYGGSQT